MTTDQEILDLIQRNCYPTTLRGAQNFARAIEQAATAPLLAQIKELEAKLSSVIDEAHEGKLRARWAHQARETAEAKLAEKDTLLRQAMEALEGFVNIASDSQGVAGYHLSGDTAEWDEFDEVDAASSAIEAIRNHLGVKND